MHGRGSIYDSITLIYVYKTFAANIMVFMVWCLLVQSTTLYFWCLGQSQEEFSNIWKSKEPHVSWAISTSAFLRCPIMRRWTHFKVCGWHLVFFHLLQLLRMRMLNETRVASAKSLMKVDLPWYRYDCQKCRIVNLLIKYIRSSQLCSLLSVN